MTPSTSMSAEFRKALEDARDALTSFAKIEMPFDASDGTWVAQTTFCNHMVTAFQVRKAAAATKAIDEVLSRHPEPPTGGDGDDPQTLRWLAGDESGKFSEGDKQVLRRAADTIARLRAERDALQAEVFARRKGIAQLTHDTDALKALGTRADGIEAAAQLLDGVALTEACADDTARGGAEAQRFRNIAASIRALSPASPKPVVGEIVAFVRGLAQKQTHNLFVGAIDEVADEIASRFGKEGG